MQITASVFPQWEVVEALLPPLLVVVSEKRARLHWHVESVRARYNIFLEGLRQYPPGMDDEAHEKMRADVEASLNGILQPGDKVIAWHGLEG